MKRIINLLVSFLLVFTMLIGCSGKPAASQKSEEEIKAEIKAELEAEAKAKAELEAEIRAEIESEQKENPVNKEPEVQQKPVETKEQQPGNNISVVKATETPKPSSQPKADNNALIESDKTAGYYKYKANAVVYFDIDLDGKNEEIKYDATNGKLNIAGYKAVDIDTMFAQTDYFIIINFKDKYDTAMNMIGIIDYGPSNDPITSLYSITALTGDKWFGSVGSVPGEIVTPSKYEGNSNLDGVADPNNNSVMDDFNYKAVNVRGQGIEAPVRMTVLPHATWFGRNLFTFYSTYNSLIDNIEKYGQDYETRMVITIQKDVKGYGDKSVNSSSFVFKAGQKAYLLATDNQEWIGMVTDDGNQGWVLAKDVTEQNFSGFPMFD